MKESKRVFSGAGMNQDVDERMLPQGYYRRMQNGRVASSEGSDGGAAKNVVGNTRLTNLGLVNGRAIGKFADSINQLIYWFITSDTKDMLLEFNVAQQQLSVILESSKPNGVLNFDDEYLITGINKIFNGESENDLLFWTDDLNPPRMINLVRAKTWPADGFTEKDISVIKPMPKHAPTVQLTFTSSTLENNLEERFFMFAVRYKYEDNQYSPFSPFSDPAFASKSFNLNYQSMENEGFVNNFNAVNVLFDTGDSSVIEVQLLIKETNSNAVFVVEKFNKAERLLGDNETAAFLFSNSKTLTALPDNQLLRSFDNVPLLAKAQENIGNRISYGNYVEGYDLLDANGNAVVMDYQLSLNSFDLAGTPLTSTLSTGSYTNDRLTFDFANIELKQGNSISIDVIMDSEIDGDYDNDFTFLFNKDYATVNELAADTSFINFIENILTSTFLANFNETPPTNGSVSSNTNFTIVANTGLVSSVTTFITIQAPTVTYEIDNSPNPSTFQTVSWGFRENQAAVFYNESGTNSSLKTNRSYEAALIYRDEYGRSTTALTDPDNTLYIPQSASTFKNKIQVQVNHQPPEWADRYQFVIKQNKGNYDTIYANLFYVDGLFRWVRLDGANKDKVKEGDTLIVKSDLSGTVADVTKVRVLEVATKESDFITGNVDENDNDIIEEQGVYMKIRPNGFDMNQSDSRIETYQDFDSRHDDPNPTLNIGDFGQTDSQGTFTFSEITAGSIINIKLESWERNRGDRYFSYIRQFVANSTFPNFQAWFEAEVTDFQQFEDDHLEINEFTDGGRNWRLRTDEGGYGWGGDRRFSGEVNIVFGGLLIFETEPQDTDGNTFYETSQTFLIENDQHQGNVQNQTLSQPAIVELNVFNCFAMGNGAESYKIKDALNKPFLDFNTRPTLADVETYRRIRRFADITYSGTYNEESNQNGLNEFNLSLANFKDDIDKKYGSIQLLHARDTDLLVFQEDKIHKVLYGKDLLFNADGSGNLASAEDVLNQHIAFTGEYGISKNPESFAYDAKVLYFTDAKRGAVMRLSNDGLTEISRNGLRNYFLDLFKDSLYRKKAGGFDPYNDEFVLGAENLDIYTPQITIPCTGNYSQTAFTGTATFDVDYGISIGTAGITYTKGAEEITVSIFYNGTNQVTVIDAGTTSGTIEFDKTVSSPTTATVTVMATNAVDFTISGQCVDATTLTVITVVVNDSTDENKTIRNRYRFNANGNNSPYKNFDTIFGENYLTTYDTNTGEQGIGAIPLDGSLITMESYKGYANTADFVVGQDRLGYVVSNTLFQEADVTNLLASGNWLTTGQTVLPSGDVINGGNFVLNRPNDEQYLYLIYDYELKNSPPVAIGDSFNIDKGVATILNVIGNDTDPDGNPLTVNIVSQPLHGTVVVNSDQTVTYTHNNSDNLADSFTYRVNDGFVNSNVATVNLFIGVSCTSGLNASGSVGIYETTVVIGSGTGTTGIIYNAFGVPDRFEIIYNGVVVADSKYVGDSLSGNPPSYTGLLGLKNLDVFQYDGSQFVATGENRAVNIQQTDVADGVTEPTAASGQITFNKTTASPTTMLVRVTGPVDGTAWNIVNICPSDLGNEGTAFNISSQSYDSGLQSDGEPACPFALNNTKYHNGTSTYPTLSDRVYNDIDITNPFDGGNNYFAIADGRTIRIDSNGVIQDVWICGAGNA